MPESKNNLIKCVKVSKQFGYFFALKNVSFEIRESTIFGIAGANGAGKTTLIKIVCGLLSPTFGKIIIDGLNYEDHSNIIKRNIGITTDESFLYENLTLYENLRYYGNLHLLFDKEKLKEKIGDFARKFNLSDWIHEPIENLSHGMKQKVELIRSVIHNPSVLFLDEPFSGLDYKATKILIGFIKKLKNKEKITIILTTHNIGVLTQICDDLIILRKGRINKSFSGDNLNEIEIKSYF
ncbi:hypothetical protein LCGC14_1134320 [marine sediment metagenome]|uniref:ABC transporter domain-containing protein n=1 Tax=marine sediment metagenome TaxID=412755 RepID=A0A0F9Q606_9ZZZZ